MAKSEAFARIHAEVMQVARAIPAGKVTTFAAIGAFLNVVPRQVAYLLARRNDPAREAAPWYRVVADNGSLGHPKYNARGQSQRELLEAEGVTVTNRDEVRDLDKRRFSPTRRNTGVTPTPRTDVPAPATTRQGTVRRGRGTSESSTSDATFRGNKAALPSKPCAACGRAMSWRRHWAKNWAEVKYCSEACRRGKKIRG